MNFTTGRRKDTRRVAGLILAPTGRIPAEMQGALNERQALIEAAVRRHLHHALKTGAGWTKRLTMPSDQCVRAIWAEELLRVALE